MAYSTLADLLEKISRDELVELACDARPGDYETDEAYQAAAEQELQEVTARAIEDADSEIESYCGERYSLPFSPVPVIVRKLSTDIAIYGLFARRQGAPEDRKVRYDNAVKLLLKLAEGTVTLGVSAPAETKSPRPQFIAPPRIFSRDKLKGF